MLKKTGTVRRVKCKRGITKDEDGPSPLALSTDGVNKLGLQLLEM